MAGLRRLLTIATLLLPTLLFGCAAPPPNPVYPEITFQHLNPLYLNVGEIKIVDEFTPPLKPPHVEHELPVSIDQTVRNWVRDRLRTTGNSGAVATVTIKDASAVEKGLEKETGLKGLITKDQSELYEFHVLVELKIMEISGSSAFVTAEATRTKSVAEGITLNQREKTYFDQVEALMRAFDPEMEKNIRAFMGAYLR
ncbi:MAG: hypothetical protein CMN56_10580 [Sneathiella sp.]|uniref:hypothetical protein n=1 Tax=Sneathiella sp. TaxID=1964365 RepID=UPI000C63F08C|nr:hypothetical protein [Sneathiella sp.]MAZ03574.1 hypothetical protein [Sneathiella sp.]